MHFHEAGLLFKFNNHIIGCFMIPFIPSQIYNVIKYYDFLDYFRPFKRLFIDLPGILVCTNLLLFVNACGMLTLSSRATYF